jgi:hypothetical protein
MASAVFAASGHGFDSATLRQPQSFFVEFNLTPELELFLPEHIAIHSS